MTILQYVWYLILSCPGHTIHTVSSLVFWTNREERSRLYAVVWPVSCPLHHLLPPRPPVCVPCQTPLSLSCCQTPAYCHTDGAETQRGWQSGWLTSPKWELLKTPLTSKSTVRTQSTTLFILLPKILRIPNLETNAAESLSFILLLMWYFVSHTKYISTRIIYTSDKLRLKAKTNKLCYLTWCI